MARLTRKEAQEQTRERLLAAAEELIAKRGVEAASLRDIADAAGYSLGAFYSNFENKEAMLREILERHMQKEMRTFREILTEGNGASMEETLVRFGAYLRRLREDDILRGLVVEFHQYANRNPSFRKEFYDSKSPRLAELAEGIRTLFERNGLALAIDPALLAQAFSALWVGFAIQGDEGGLQSIELVTVFFLNALLGSAAPV